MTTFSPEFLKKNYISSVSEISDSAGTNDINKLKLIDKNTDLQYATIGATTGTRTITITFSAAQTIDRIFLQNHNGDSYTIKYNTSLDFSTPISESGNTSKNNYYRFNSVTVNNIVISVTNTQTAGQVFKLGQIIATESFLNVDGVGGGSRVEPNTAQVVFSLSDLSSDKTFIKTNFNFVIRYTNVIPSIRETFIEIYDYNKRNSFYYIDQPDDTAWNGIAGPVLWNNSDDYHNYSNDIPSNGYDVNIDLVSAGGTA